MLPGYEQHLQHLHVLRVPRYALHVQQHDWLHLYRVWRPSRTELLPRQHDLAPRLRGPPQVRLVGRCLRLRRHPDYDQYGDFDQHHDVDRDRDGDGRRRAIDLPP